VQEVPGRIWDGKEAVLAAAGALSAACTAALAPAQRRRLVEALLDAGGKKKAAYRKAALEQLEGVLTAFAGSSGAKNSSSGDGGSGGEEGSSEGNYYSLVAPLMLELVGSYVEAAHGGAAMETDGQQAAGQGQGEEGEPHPGRAVPAAQVATCLGAAFATAAPDTARQHADATAASLAALLGAAGKPGEQLAAVAAGCRLAEHAASVAARAPGAGAVLSPGQAGVAALLAGALRLAEEGKVSELREQCYRLRWV
jgi:proteasome component ECM29